jgi:hypothetical protein
VTFTDHVGLWGNEWIALSTCGHYAIGHDKSNPHKTKFQALHVPGVWATAEKIGRARTDRVDAEAACEKHALTPDFAKLASLTKGL